MRAYPCGDSVPRHVIPITIQTKRSRAALHLPFAMNTFHTLTPLFKVFRPLRRIRKICCDYSQIFVFRRTHNMDCARSVTETQYQTAVPARIVRIILNQLTLRDCDFHFRWNLSCATDVTFDESRGGETTNVFALRPEHLPESPLKYPQLFKLQHRGISAV